MRMPLSPRRRTPAMSSAPTASSWTPSTPTSAPTSPPGAPHADSPPTPWQPLQPPDTPSRSPTHASAGPSPAGEPDHHGHHARRPQGVRRTVRQCGERRVRVVSVVGVVAAVDLGASSGRVMLGRVGPNELSLRSVARFPNNPVRTIDGLHWNLLELYRSVLGGLRAAARQESELASVAVDSWAVDYALMHGDRMLANPYHYRDERTGAGVAAAHALVAPEELYAGTGLQFLPFNTCLLYTSDAADDLLCVDLGGRRII